jgi:hypothetical protein
MRVYFCCHPERSVISRWRETTRSRGIRSFRRTTALKGHGFRRAAQPPHS